MVELRHWLRKKTESHRYPEGPFTIQNLLLAPIFSSIVNSRIHASVLLIYSKCTTIPFSERWGLRLAVLDKIITMPPNVPRCHKGMNVLGIRIQFVPFFQVRFSEICEKKTMKNIQFYNIQLAKLPVVKFSFMNLLKIISIGLLYIRSYKGLQFS